MQLHNAPTVVLFLTHISLATDQSEINRIIAEASKGSKFYEARPTESLIHVSLTVAQNEKKKDKVLTERIERILNYRDDAVKGVDISALSSSSVIPCHLFINLFRKTRNVG